MTNDADRIGNMEQISSEDQAILNSVIASYREEQKQIMRREMSTQSEPEIDKDESHA